MSPQLPGWTISGDRQSAATRSRNPKVSVVIPALNEAGSLPFVLERIPREVHEVLLVDGRSSDDTIDIARRNFENICIVMQPGDGKGDALRAGFAAATGDVIVALDADGSTDPAEIPAFVGALCAGADFAKGSRFLQGGGTSDMPIHRKLGNRDVRDPRSDARRGPVFGSLLRLQRVLEGCATEDRPGRRRLRNRGADEHPRAQGGSARGRGGKLREPQGEGRRQAPHHSRRVASPEDNHARGCGPGRTTRCGASQQAGKRELRGRKVSLTLRGRRCQMRGWG